MTTNEYSNGHIIIIKQDCTILTEDYIIFSK